MKKRVGVLISGGGSNMKALVAAGRAADAPFEVVCVASNTPEAAGIAWARHEGLTTQVINHKDFGIRESFDSAFNQYLQSQGLDLIACAGFMRIMTKNLITPWQGRMLNIHPSLLPKYRGLHTHQRAIDAGDAEAGCSVHWVTLDLDGGPIIAQSRVRLLPGDTAETLAARVLVEEHKLYPKVLAQVARS